MQYDTNAYFWLIAPDSTIYTSDTIQAQDPVRPVQVRGQPNGNLWRAGVQYDTNAYFRPIAPDSTVHTFANSQANDPDRPVTEQGQPNVSMPSVACFYFILSLFFLYQIS